MKTLFQRPDRILDPLYVLTVVFNSARYRSRWKLYEDFARRVEQAGAILYTVEVAFGAREFAITQPDNPHHLQLRSSHELWLKENALALLAQRLPPEARYVAWVDADVRFARDDWANETVHKLQHHPVVQMWTEAVDLDSSHEVLQRHRSLAWCEANPSEVPAGLEPPGYYARRAKGAARGMIYKHPGFAWAFRRETLDQLGGLLDWCVVGSADYLMAEALFGRRYTGAWLGATGERWLAIWCDRADRYVRGDVGYVDGALLHYWHGSKAGRRYLDRRKILADAGFDPEIDLKRDWQGLWCITERSSLLRDQLRAYFHNRAEDSL